MKKFLLVAVAALAVVACKKDDNGGNDTPPAITADKSSIPTTVDFAYPKSTVMTDSYGSVTTVSYTVSNKLLTNIKVESGSRVEEFKLRYNADKYLTSIESGASDVLTYSYNNKGQIVGVSGKVTGNTYSRTLEYNAQGKLTKIIQREGDNRWPDNHDITIDYSVANQVKVVDEWLSRSNVSTSTYELDAKGNILKKFDENAITTYSDYDDKVNIRSKSPFNFFDKYGNFRVYGDVHNFLHSTNNPRKETFFARGSETTVTTHEYSYQNNLVTKNITVLGTSTTTTTYNY